MGREIKREKNYRRTMQAPVRTAVITYPPSCQTPTCTALGLTIPAAPLELEAEEVEETWLALPVGDEVTVPVPAGPASLRRAEQVPEGALDFLVDAAPLKSQADWALPFFFC